MLITAAALNALRTGFQTSFQKGFDAEASVHEQIATTVPSSTKSNTYGWLGQWPDMREWIGDRQLKSMQEHGYSITNKDWEATVEVDRNDIDDDNLGMYGPMFEAAGQAARRKPDQLVFSLLKAGHTTACYDGQYFFDTDHPVAAEVDGTGAVATVSNVQAGASAPWYLLDTSRPLKPLIFQNRKSPQFTAMDTPTDENVFMRKKFRYGVDSRSNVGFGFWQMAFKSSAELTVANFEAAYAAMRMFTGDGGVMLGVKPTLLVVPPSLRSKANDLVTADRLANGADNPNKGLVRVIDTPWVA
jgi:phage major head subunit gpT-like protein